LAHSKFEAIGFGADDTTLQGFGRTAIEQQRVSGLNASRFCKKRSLKRRTFLRWLYRLAELGNDQDFIVRSGVRNGYCLRMKRLEIALPGSTACPDG
jgi:hypothetical protein